MNVLFRFDAGAGLLHCLDVLRAQDLLVTTCSERDDARYSALRRLPFVDRQTRNGQGWALDVGLQDQLDEVAGKVVGLVGFGAVPSLLAPILAAMDAQVIYCANSTKNVPYARHSFSSTSRTSIQDGQVNS